jgi:peptide subunit release factor 1 (eRF1)
MISPQELERLASLKSDHGILTAYIDLDPSLRFVRRLVVAQFKGALKAAQRRVQDTRWREALERESARVLDYLSGWEPKSRGLAIFSCGPASIWEVVPVNFSVPNLVDVDATTKTGTLTQTLDEVPYLLVAVVQKDKSRIYITEQGMLERQFEIGSDVPGRHKQGGRAQMRFQRHIDFHVTEHLKKMVEEIERLAQTSRFELVLGGTDEIVTDVLTLLSKPTKRKVLGKFPVDYKQDSEQQILERAQLIWQDRKELAEVNLLDQVIEAAKSGRQGVLGVEPTLNALVEEKVRILLIANGIAIQGSACTRCDYFSEKDFRLCPLCGTEGERRDVTDRAVEKTVLTGAASEVISSAEGRKRLLAEGGLGALLRY